MTAGTKLCACCQENKGDAKPALFSEAQGTIFVRLSPTRGFYVCADCVRASVTEWATLARTPYRGRYA